MRYCIYCCILFNLVSEWYGSNSILIILTSNSSHLIPCLSNTNTIIFYTKIYTDQFRALFGASRVPKRSAKDTIAVYEKTNHVAVMCCNQLFYFQALWPDGDVAVDEGDLADILEAIRVYAHNKLEKKKKPNSTTTTTIPGARGIPDSTKRGGFSGSNSNNIDNEDEDKNYVDSMSALGVLTSLGRNQWAKAREEMIQFSPAKNTESFKIVDSALFVLVLDDYIPKNKHEAAANMLHGSYELSERRVGTMEGRDPYDNEYQSGSCTNRWYDKLQVSIIYCTYIRRQKEGGWIEESSLLICNADSDSNRRYFLFFYFIILSLSFKITDHCDS